MGASISPQDFGLRYLSGKIGTMDSNVTRHTSHSGVDSGDINIPIFASQRKGYDCLAFEAADTTRHRYLHVVVFAPDRLVYTIGLGLVLLGSGQLFHCTR